MPMWNLFPLPHWRRPAALPLILASGLAMVGCRPIVRTENAEGVRHYRQGDFAAAVDRFREALSRQPGSPDCFYNLGAAHHQLARCGGPVDDLRLAEQYYHLCLARSPDHGACQRALAVLLVEERRTPEGVALLEAWAARQPDNPAPRLDLARISQDHGDLAGAERHLAAALAIDPANRAALAAIGSIRRSGVDPGTVASATGLTPAR